MRPQLFYDYIVSIPVSLLNDWPGIAIPDSEAARVLLMAIAGQESKWTARLQGGGGPARSYYQFEGSGGGLGEVFAGCPQWVRIVCEALDIPFDQRTVFEAMAWNGILQTCMARFLLWVGRPDPLPPYGDEGGAYQYYDSIWRPGAKRPHDWHDNYVQAVLCVEHFKAHGPTPPFGHATVNV